MVAAIVALLGACGTGEDVATEIEPQDPDLVAAGEPLYNSACAACHGFDLRGTDRGPSHLSEIYRPSHHADFSFALAVQQGSRAHHWQFGDMPPIAGLSTDDIAAITAYVRETQRTEGFESYPP